MPRATEWAPALLPSRGGVTARPTPSGSIPNSDSVAATNEIAEAAEHLYYPLSQLRRPR
jgi:hypothetical protein